MSIDRRLKFALSFGVPMAWKRSLWRAFLLAFGMALAASANAQQQPAPQTSKPAKASSQAAKPAVKPELEAKAIEILKATSARLAAAHSMTFTALVTYESPSRLGPALAYTTKSEVTMQRPDKVRVLTLGDGPPSEFYYDGKTMTAFEPEAGLAAVAPAPPTIDAALKAAYDTAAIYFPFTDVLVADPYGDLADVLQYAFYIGQSKIVGGTTTDMVAFANDNVFVQAWIGADDKLPRMLRAVFRADPQRLRHQLEFTNWQLDPSIPPDAFASASAAAAKRIAFARPDVPQGLEPPPKAKPSKASNKS
jgi:hypothetical protein